MLISVVRWHWEMSMTSIENQGHGIEVVINVPPPSVEEPSTWNVPPVLDVPNLCLVVLIDHVTMVEKTSHDLEKST
eukprot:scaffold1465_cov93-Cylindrotheca_fusiformis.AAC.2